MKYIESADNPIIKKAESLKQRKYREKEGLYLIEGFNLCKEALEANAGIECLILREPQATESKIDKTFVDKVAGKGNFEFIQMLKGLATEAVTVVAVKDKLFDRLMDTETPQGIAAIVKKKVWDPSSFFKKEEGEKSRGNILVLDRIQDPGNAGTLLRTAEAAGFQGVIAVKGTVDSYSPKVVRSAAGTLFRISMLFTEGEKETIELLRANGKRIVATTPYCEKHHFQAELSKDIALVIGNEGCGISNAFLDEADCKVKIPMAGDVESLNAAVAAGILMFETVRQNFQKEVEE